MNTQWNKLPELAAGFTTDLLQIAIYDLHTNNEKCVIVLEQDPPNFFEAMETILAYTRKAKLPLPLIVNREFITQSLDSYPLEFINISSDYEHVFCKEDLLEKLTFNAKDIRLQIEREIKSKWLLTRMAVLENMNDIKKIHHIVRMSVEGLLPALKGFCYLKNVPIPQEPHQLFDLVNELTPFDTDPIRRMYSLTRKDLNLGVVNRYLQNLESLIKIMETWEV